MDVRRFRRYFAILMTLALVMIPVAAVRAAPGGIPGPPPGKGEETLTFNLSVPAIIVGTNPFPIICPLADVDAPEGTPLGGYPIDPSLYWYVQKVHQWQAECATGPTDGSLQVAAGWGDNLTGAPLKARTPIRVEIGLEAASTVTPMTGYLVEKLNADALDRVAPYGTLATQTDGVWSAIPTEFPWSGTVIDHETGLPVQVTTGVRVFTAGATFSIQNLDTGAYVVGPNAPMSAEINATGKIVYGYNWGTSRGGEKNLPTEGTFEITFNAPNLTITDPGVGQLVDSDTIKLVVTVGPKVGGGGPKPRAETMNPYVGDQLRIEDRMRDRDGSCLLP